MERDHKTQEFAPFDIPACFIGFDLTFLLKNSVSKNFHRIIDPSELYYDENQKTKDDFRLNL